MARYLLKRSAVIIARDKQSQAIAQELVGNQREVLLSPDVAFTLQPVLPKILNLDPPLAGHFPSSGVIGLNVNGLMYNGGYSRDNAFGLELDYVVLLPNLIAALLEAHSGELWLIPHTYAPSGSVESDNEASLRVREALPRELQARVRVITSEYNCHELKGIIGLCEFFVGSRMHSCIAALSQGVPCVGIAYSMKFKGVFESVGMQDWVIDARESTSSAAEQRTLSLFGSRVATREKLKNSADSARQSVEAAFASLFTQMALASRPNLKTQKLVPVLK